jgi:hypothetical protein
MSINGKSKQGFASMDLATRRAIASRGGKAAHASGRAHVFTRAEAAAAGSKGGKAAQAKGVCHRFTSAQARVAGRKGGLAKKHQRKVGTEGA